MLKTRIKTAVVVLAIVGLVLVFSYIPAVTTSFVSILNLFACWEIFKAGGADKNYPFFVPTAIAAGILPELLTDNYVSAYLIVLTVLLPVMVILALLAMQNMDTLQIKKPWLLTVISLVIALFVSSIAVMRRLDHGLALLILSLVIPIITDTMAYFGGRKWGRHKLAPAVSPKKTVEGSAAGTVSGIAAALVFGVVMQFAFGVSVNYIGLSVYAACASVIGQIGDLSLSIIKRVNGIKDYSQLLPGHGGILDRIDSEVLTSPFSFIFFAAVCTMFS